MNVRSGFSFGIMFTLGCILASAVYSQDWPQWRGPATNHHAAKNSTAPIKWSGESGLAWKTAIPGRGNSSPTLVRDKLFLTTGDESAKTQSLLILNRANGEIVNQIVVHNGGLPGNVHGKNSHANSTVASDGQRVFVMFLNDEAPILTAFDLNGKELWRKRVCGPTRINFEWGFGSSPIVVNDCVIVATEFNVAGSGIYAFDTKTGKQKWFASRSNQFSYSTPSIATDGDRSFLLMSGNGSFSAYDVDTGKELWTKEGTTMATCSTMVWDQFLNLGFACGGHPDRFVAAVKLTEPHDIKWQHPVKCYEQSLLTFEGFVYAVSDNGVAFCWNAQDGKEMWKKRLRGNFSSSPLVVDKKIFVTNESGETFIFEANSQEFVSLGSNHLGDRAYATPTPADGRLYHRYGDGKQEFIAAIGK